MIDKLRNFDVDRASLDELVELSAFGRGIQAEFAALSVEEPEWVNVRLRELRRELSIRRTDFLEKELAAKKARLEVLLPTEERRKKLAEEIAALEAKMAGAAG